MRATPRYGSDRTPRAATGSFDEDSGDGEVAEVQEAAFGASGMYNITINTTTPTWIGPKKVNGAVCQLELAFYTSATGSYANKLAFSAVSSNGQCLGTRN